MMNMEESLDKITCVILLITIYMFSKIHVMNNLIIIEFTIVSILTILFSMMKTMEMENYLILYIIILSICESMVGLSTMISMIRTHSNDYLKSLNIMKF